MIGWIIGAVILLWFFAGFRVVRPTHMAAKETFGKYTSMTEQGLRWVFFPFQTMRYVNITERMADVDPQEIITNDNLNATVDLIVYYKVKPTEENVKRSLYAVHRFEDQIINLARTTARNVIGSMDFKDVNSKRNELNEQLRKILDKESDAWGVEVVRVELKEILPPKNVQDSMNKIIMAENEKRAAVDFANARETEADGIRRAAIKEASGKKEATVLEAEGMAKGKIIVADAEAYRIQKVYGASDKFFKGNAQRLKQLEVTQSSLENNSKVIVTDKGVNPQLIVGEIPIVEK